MCSRRTIPVVVLGFLALTAAQMPWAADACPEISDTVSQTPLGRVGRVPGVDTDTDCDGLPDSADFFPDDPTLPVQGEFDHAAVFAALAGDVDRPEVRQRIWPSYYRDDRGSWREDFHFARQSGYLPLHARFGGHVPTGRFLTILQLENNQTPDSAGAVSRLWSAGESDEHSTAVVYRLNTLDDFPYSPTRFTTFSPGLRSFHTGRTDEWKRFADFSLGPVSYPATDHLGNAVTPAKLVNVSNTNGAGDNHYMIEFDHFVHLNDMVACTAITNRSFGNISTSGMSYNAIVVGSVTPAWSNFSGPQWNYHGTPRVKPDMIGWATATSIATPAVCSAAALLLERTMVDHGVRAAYSSEVIKAILMAGAQRQDEVPDTDWTENESEADFGFFRAGEWHKTTSQPGSVKYGAGALHVDTAYGILDAGQFSPQEGGADLKRSVAKALTSKHAAVPSTGWDRQTGLVAGDIRTYRFALSEPSQFSAVLVWQRIIDASRAWRGSLPDFRLTLRGPYGRIQSWSDTTTANVELVDSGPLAAGDYSLEVYAKDLDGLAEASYGLAWVAKASLPRPDFAKVTEAGAGWSIRWGYNELGLDDDFRYRVRIWSRDEELATAWVKKPEYDFVPSHGGACSGPTLVEVVAVPKMDAVRTRSRSNARTALGPIVGC